MHSILQFQSPALGWLFDCPGISSLILRLLSSEYLMRMWISVMLLNTLMWRSVSLQDMSVFCATKLFSSSRSLPHRSLSLFLFMSEATRSFLPSVFPIASLISAFQVFLFSSVVGRDYQLSTDDRHVTSSSSCAWFEGGFFCVQGVESSSYEHHQRLLAPITGSHIGKRFRLHFSRLTIWVLPGCINQNNAVTGHLFASSAQYILYALYSVPRLGTA